MVEDSHPERGQPRADETLTRLAGGLAHEIKNPLSTMAINLALLEEEWSRGRGAEASDLDPREKRSLRRLRTLQREVVRLEGVLEDFLRFARGAEVNRSPADLVALVRDVLEFLEPEHQKHGIRMHADLPNKLPLAMLDETAFRQALINLMVNARQAMPGGGELIVRLERVAQRAELSVTDTGVGMAPEELERCFDLYYSTKKGGSGLGLATVRRIVQQHEGFIRGVSEKGRGTSFTISLPLLVEITGRPGESEERGELSKREKPRGAGDA